MAAGCSTICLPISKDEYLALIDEYARAGLCYEQALAAAATDRIKLGHMVTNPGTREPSVTASALATSTARYPLSAQGDMGWKRSN